MFRRPAPEIRRAWLAPLSALALLCCQGTIGDGGAPSRSEPPPDDVEPLELQAPVLPRLTNAQYRHAVEDLLGAELPTPPLEPDENPYLFYSIGAASTSLSELGVQRLEEAADALTEAVFAEPSRRLALVGCEPAAVDDACVQDFVRTFGRRAFRRPLTAPEVGRWVAVARDLSEGDPWLGLRTVVAGLLQSPHFVYRVELGEPDPDDASRSRYTSWEMASRLAFSLVGSIPDDALLDAAESGALNTAEGVEAEARRLLATPRARESIQEFFAQYFDLVRLERVTRNAQTYPGFSETTPASMRTEVKLLVDDLVNRRDTDIRSVFSTRRTFVNSELAALYGLDAPGASPIAFVPVELAEDSPRRGLLTLGAFLTMNAHETETSPTLRGKYVRERVLCQDVPPPPDDVDIDITPEPGAPPKTLRERLEQHRDDPACAGCHAFIDPPGMLFEHFDSVGAWRTDDNGYPIDATGDLDGAPLENARELAEALERDERVGQCIVTQLYRHTQSRLDDRGEEAALAELDALFAAKGYRFRELLVALVTHESFRYVKAVEVTP